MVNHKHNNEDGNNTRKPRGSRTGLLEDIERFVTIGFRNDYLIGVRAGSGFIFRGDFLIAIMADNLGQFGKNLLA